MYKNNCISSASVSLLPLNLFMHFVSFNVDGREGTCRTQVLAGATAYAAGLVDGGDVGRRLVVGVGGYHLDGTLRTVACTVAARHTVGERYAVLSYPYGMAYLRGGLHLDGNGLDGAGGTHLRAARTLRAAVAALVRHDRLHQVHQVVGGAQHLVGTFRDAQLAPRAVRLEVLL